MSLCVCVGSCLCAAALLGYILHKYTDSYNNNKVAEIECITIDKSTIV
uniref:Uncharacterized protein n=1 Tax=viral metagenome TaxID=1070528 RepID=A0A6C0ARK2_9ZZZZ